MDRATRVLVALRDVFVGREAGDQDGSFGLGVEQVPDVSRMNDVEGAVAHDDLFLPWSRADRVAHLIRGLDLVREQAFAGGIHQPCPWGDRYSNQVLVAFAIESGSQSGALRQ